MVRILVCDSCRLEAEKSNHLDLYSTYRSIIFGCQHSIEQLKREVNDQVELARETGDTSSQGTASEIVKHSKVEYKNGLFMIKNAKH